MAPKLARKFEKFQQDAQQRTRNINREYQRNAPISKFKAEELENKFTEKEYEAQLNDVGNLQQQHYDAATTYKGFNIEQNQVSRLGNVQQYEQGALDYDKQTKEEEFLKLKKEEQIESLLVADVKQIIGKHEWNKAFIENWMNAILKSMGDLLDKYLKDGVYKYCIDVNIVKSTAIARQTDVLKATSDFSWNLKVKNGFGVMVLINSHAFKIN
eukprot:CAMPEP_0202693074 /NCGR_PEP_ID=MMETSP1385-20130828/7295_1 /ASSEMBLY_ACC=CAM_ASM_000861 /TAXON_ID=933848 /ORGANISM="Elphidium margaritaceum" /LENGTH=212 /DNA_ID=CAMNT_0049348711 /DNA_START=59 /DNA_END=697 /DNA_ORIENTATION=-